MRWVRVVPGGATMRYWKQIDCNPACVGVWRLSSSSDPRALAVVDGLGMHDGVGPHYSRRTPGSRTFTGVGQEVVLVSACGRAVWACVRARLPRRGPTGELAFTMFRNLGAGLSSVLIVDAVEMTRAVWLSRYGELPSEPMRTEVKVNAVRSKNPGYCYRRAGWTRQPQSPRHRRRGLLVFHAPEVP